MKIAVASLLLVLAAAPQVNVAGRWEGTLSAQRSDGTPVSESTLLILEQKEKTITGSVGRDESDRHPITSGTIDGTKVVLAVKNARNDREYRVELTVDGDEMKGTIATGGQTAQIEVKRRKA